MQLLQVKLHFKGGLVDQPHPFISQRAPRTCLSCTRAASFPAGPSRPCRRWGRPILGRLPWTSAAASLECRQRSFLPISAAEGLKKQTVRIGFVLSLSSSLTLHAEEVE